MGELVNGKNQKYPDITNKMEMLKKERKLMKKCNAILNQSVPGRTTKEYSLYYRFGDNRKDYLKKRKEYREKHNDEIMECRLNNKGKIREADSKYKQQKKKNCLPKTISQ
jgi:hypothetical protein